MCIDLGLGCVFLVTWKTRPNLFFHHTGRFLMRLQSGKLEIWWSEQTNQCTVGSWTPEWYRRPLKSGICGYKNRHSFVDFVAFSPHQFFGRWKENCSFKDQYVLVTDGRALRSPAVQGIDYHDRKHSFAYSSTSFHSSVCNIFIFSSSVFDTYTESVWCTATSTQIHQPAVLEQSQVNVGHFVISVL